MAGVIVDTSVMIDIVLATRPRHADADRLWQELKRSGIRIRMPMHALFELGSALKQERISQSDGRLKFNVTISQQHSLEIDPVPIDEEFVTKYYSGDLPYLKAGDLIFVAMAKADGAILITEDDTQYKKAKEAGIAVYRTREYLETVTGI